MPVQRRSLLAVLLAAPLLSCGGGAPDPALETGRLRGTITRKVGSYVWIATREGRTHMVAVPTDVPISLSVPARLSDIQQNDYIGTAAVPQPDGTLRALEVHVFPEELRGLGVGNHPWDLQPGSSVTNGIVGKLERTNGLRLLIVYPGGQQTVVVPPDVPITTYQPGDKDLLVPGAHVIVSVEASTDAVLRAKRIVVGANGMMPPM